MVGLDAAGKTTILYKLKLGEGECFRPLWTFMDILSACAREEVLATQFSHSSYLLVNLFTTL
jgi:hypothetical protein